jgi:hypothetical protein
MGGPRIKKKNRRRETKGKRYMERDGGERQKEDTDGEEEIERDRQRGR